MKRIFSMLLIIFTISLSAQTICEPIDELLKRDELQSSEIGISVFDLSDNKYLYRYQDEKLYRPASIEKIITTVTALARLDSSATFDTKIEYSGKIVNDTLYGNLYLVGGFDPEFMESDLDSLVRAIKRHGIKYIADSVVADVSMKDSLYWGPGWAWDDTPFYFQPYLSPLMLNRGCVDIYLTPSVTNAKPSVKVYPYSSYYSIVNEGVSKNKNAGKLEVTRDWVNNKNIIYIKGDVSKATKKTINVYDSKEFFLRTFLERLKENGIHYKSSAFSHTANESTEKEIAIIRRPINNVIYRALKKSDNLCAEAIYYKLASRITGKKNIGSEEAGSVINSFIKDILNYPGHYKIVDGSGVSMYDYVSPELIMEYLKFVNRYPHLFSTFYNSLPIAGVDGTLKNRMKYTKVHGNVHAKTGTVTGVSSLAGYARAKNGHLIAFVIINQNILNTSIAHKVQDDICKIIINHE